jgi:hypothetical protein
MTPLDKVEANRRLSELAKLILFYPINEIYRLFKVDFDNKAILYKSRLPLNSSGNKNSYIAQYETNNFVITKISWIVNDERIVIDIQSTKDTADRHGEGKPNGY